MMCLYAIPSLDSECSLSRGDLLLLLLQLLLPGQIDQWIATQYILHANSLLLGLLLPLLKWEKKQRHSMTAHLPHLKQKWCLHCAVQWFKLYFAFLLFSPFLLDLLQFCQKRCSVIVIAVLLRVLVLIVL